MNRGKQPLFALTAILIAVLCAGCEKNPINRLVNPATANTTGAWGDIWVLYDDQVKTNGDIKALTSFDGQVLDFNCVESPQDGDKCIKISWNGAAVYWYSEERSQHDFAGFIFKVNKEDDAASSVTKDLSSAGYTKISFWARGSLSANVFLRLEGNNAVYTTPSGTNAWMSNTSDRQITTSWQYYEFPISGSLASVSDFLRVILRYDVDGNPDTANSIAGNGGTVYIDNIRLTK